MDSSISHVICHDTSAFSIFHNQIEAEIFNEENAIVTKSSTEESVKHTMAGSVGDRTATVSLSTLTVIL